MDLIVVDKEKTGLFLIESSHLGIFMLGRRINDYIVILPRDDGKDEILRFPDSETRAVQAVVDKVVAKP
jgi:hypothetical protein